MLTGRAIAARARDSNILKYTGKVPIVAELAEKYNLVDPNGDRPVALRSLPQKVKKSNKKETRLNRPLITKRT